VAGKWRVPKDFPQSAEGPGRLGELLAGDARLEALADQTAQLGVGGVECVLAAFAPRLESLEPTDDVVERLN
jgi:hypothetical protein